MVEIIIQTNVAQVIPQITRLTKTMEKSSASLGLELAKQTVVYAKRNASFGGEMSTGALAGSITYMKKGDNIYAVGFAKPASRYGRYAERGFRAHIIPYDFIEQHMSMPGIKGMDTRSLGYRATRWVWVSKLYNRQGYIVGPAARQAVQDLPKIWRKIRARR